MSSTVAPWSGRLAYVAMCLTICWGVLTATGWVRAMPGARVTHRVLATFSVALGVTHALALAAAGTVEPFAVVLPFGPPRHALGVLGLELMVAVAVTAALRGAGFYWNRLPVHRLAYVAVWLCAMHAWLGAAANGSVPVLWLAGITVLVPTITLTLLRVLPPEALLRLGIRSAPGDAEPAAFRVSVDHGLCRHFALCQAQAPRVFRLLEDGTLRYARNPGPDQADHVAAAARACPMRAVRVVDGSGLPRG
ncbi:ferredoxin [Saccharothrix sp. NPDC042600]|uniref:ferredoxin n=1 Tax=Saccharothrix TaxID=2071 RepID=UPI003400ABEB|nr:ferredoxin [Saccharothrix mutabilis subsp. capreolus]